MYKVYKHKGISEELPFPCKSIDQNETTFLQCAITHKIKNNEHL